MTRLRGIWAVGAACALVATTAACGSGAAADTPTKRPKTKVSASAVDSTDQQADATTGASGTATPGAPGSTGGPGAPGDGATSGALGGGEPAPPGGGSGNGAQGGALGGADPALHPAVPHATAASDDTMMLVHESQKVIVPFGQSAAVAFHDPTGDHALTMAVDVVTVGPGDVPTQLAAHGPQSFFYLKTTVRNDSPTPVNPRRVVTRLQYFSTTERQLALIPGFWANTACPASDPQGTLAPGASTSACYILNADAGRTIEQVMLDGDGMGVTWKAP